MSWPDGWSNGQGCDDCQHTGEIEGGPRSIFAPCPKCGVPPKPPIDPAIRLLADQGYVPETCTLPPDLVVALVLSEVSKGRSPCWGCNDDRTICKGQPKREL